MRLQAAEWFAEGIEPPEVARRLRVSGNSAYAWRRRWRDGGQAALASRGPGGAVCQLDGGQLGRLRAALEAGPAVWGWDGDQRWTLARVSALIARLFHLRYTLRGTSFLLHRDPARRAVCGPSTGSGAAACRSSTLGPYLKSVYASLLTIEHPFTSFSGRSLVTLAPGHRTRRAAGRGRLGPARFSCPGGPPEAQRQGRAWRVHVPGSWTVAVVLTL